MRIVVGCPVAERGWALPQWLEAIHRQRFEDVELRIVCLYTESHDDTLAVLQNGGAEVVYGPLPPRPRAKQRAHIWSYDDGDFAYMTTLRNALLEYVRDRHDPDYFFSLDSDVILPTKGTVHRLAWALEHEGADAIAPLVNVGDPPYPPAWNFMHINTRQRTASRPDIERYALPDEPFPTDVIMAACLQNRRAQKVRWADHKQGEDIGWGLRAREKRVRVLVHPRIECAHLMRPTA